MDEFLSVLKKHSVVYFSTRNWNVNFDTTIRNNKTNTDTPPIEKNNNRTIISDNDPAGMDL